MAIKAIFTALKRGYSVHGTRGSASGRRVCLRESTYRGLPTGSLHLEGRGSASGGDWTDPPRVCVQGGICIEGGLPTGGWANPLDLSAVGLHPGWLGTHPHLPQEVLSQGSALGVGQTPPPLTGIRKVGSTHSTGILSCL